MTNVRWPFVGSTRPFQIVGSDGVWLVASDGRRILDAAGGAIVCNVGHGRAVVADAVARATREATYVVPPWLTPSRIALLERLERDWLPADLPHVHLASGGSEGVETAMKLAIQFHAARGQPERTKIVGRDLSYHGTTLATTAVGGHAGRKKGLAHALPTYPHAPTPYPLRGPRGANDSNRGQFYVDALRAVIESEGPGTVAAFLAEPITGSSGGAIVPPDDYWPGVRALCDEFGILLLMDEVMTGFGRTGRRFGFEHWPIRPDVLVAGKGLAGGYAPIVGVYATSTIAKAIEGAGMNVMFHTFGAHPAACAAANEVLRILTEERLVERAARLGTHLGEALRDAFGNHPHVAEVRGRGLLQAIEIVADRATLARFPLAANVTDRVVGAALGRGVFFYPGGTGEQRDIVCLGPPFVVDASHVERMVEVLRASVDEVVATARAS
jgi:adenosylmethionine-8-amino-7-oxononanoate aminotransferase